MKKATILVPAVLLVGSAVSADPDPRRLVGQYVEARTAEVFAGACVMNGEAETAGRQAIMAWRISSGRFNGVPLDGLTVAAAVAADRHLGMRELGGEAPQAVRAVITVDARANAAQRLALVQLARELSGGLITEVVRVDVAPVRFATTARYIEVSAADLALTVDKEMRHDPSCGARQWFTPFNPNLTESAMGTADAHRYSGSGLDSRWSAPHKRSAFWGTFVY